MATALGIGSLIGGIGSLFGGIFGASAASKAAAQQLAAQKQAVGELQGSEAQALNYQGRATDTSLARLQPYLSAGTAAEGNLADLTATPGQGLLTPWTQQFSAPTAEQAAATPGYQFQLQQGENAVQNSAAARGGLLSGGTLADMNNYAQGTASTNYQNQFNNAQAQYQSGYQTFLNNQQNTYNMLSGQAQVGQNAANSMGTLSQMGAQNYGAITTNTGSDIAGLLGQQGATQAGGTLGTAQALAGIPAGVSNSLLNYGVLSQLNPGSSNSTNPLYPGSSGTLPTNTQGAAGYTPLALPPPQ